MQYITRRTRFDSGHRVLNQSSKCRFFHAHSNGVELTYSFETMQDLGYPIDFKEIKRTHCAWIDDHLDHGFVANPHDTSIIELCKQEESRLWVMSLEGDNFCNPTCENIAREVFLAIDVLTTAFYPALTLHQVKLYETENCYTVCYRESVPDYQRTNFLQKNKESILQYGKDKGVLEYDVTKGGEMDES